MADEKKSTGKSKALTQLEKDVYETFGMLPNEDRLTLLPRYKKGEGFIAPEMLYELAKAVQSPRTAMYSELGPEEAINMGLNVMGGSSVASAPRGALRMGIARPTLEPERRAALMEAERALPLNLPRAPAKSKQEIAAHAERVGRQMLGEHVRTGKPKDAQNLAGRSMKESQRLQKLQYELEPIKTLPPLTTVQPRIGDINVAVPGDASISDILLKSIEGEPIGSVQQGGSLYGLGKLDRDDPLFWASNEGPAQQMQDKITDLAALFDPERVLAQHLAMGRVANNFAQHFADASLRAIDYSKLSAKDMNTFDNVIAGGYTKKDKKTGEVKRITFPNWPGIADPEGALAAMKSDPEMRKWFLSRMKTRKLTKATNMPNALDIEWAITHPELRNMEVNLTGHSVGEMVPGAKLADDPDHETYLKGIRGTFLGQQENLTPFAISYPDAAQHVASTQRPQDFTGTIQKVFPHQRVDQQYLDEYYEYMRQLQKMLTGRKKGGAVEEVEGGLAPYGLRHSGEGVKGKGYFGLLPNKMDGVSTEISVEDETGEYPLIVPTLTAEELDRLLAGGDPTPEMLDKASSWAATRRKRGESPFASPTEVRMPRPKAEGGSVSLTDLPDEVNPSNWREHLQNNVRADARALLGAKDGGVINLDDLIEKSLEKKDGGVINLDELIDWTLAKAEHRKMKEGGAVKMQGGGNPGEVAGDMFKPKPLSIPEPITSFVEALRRQFEKEKRSMSKPGAAQDVLMRGPVAAYAGAPADILGMGGELLDYAQKKIPALRKPASVMDTGPEKVPPMGYAPVFPLSPEGSYGTTAAQEMMGKAGLTTGEERPLFETGAMVGAPVAGYAGLKAGKALAPTAKEMLDVQLQRMMSPYQMNVIKSEGGNWVRGSTDKFLSGLRYDDEVDRLRIYTPEARAEEQARVDAYNNFIDKKLKRYMENQLGTPSDPVRIQADAWAETQKTLLAEKEKQISKVRSDIEKARRERNVDPEVLTRSQARLRQLQNEKDLIKNRKGLHFTPVTGDNSFAALEAASRRSQFGAPRERVAQSEIGKRWEDRADLSIYQQPYMDQPQIGIAKNYAEIKNAAEGTNIVDKAILDEVNKELEKMGGKYALENPEALAYRTSGGLDNLGFQHLADELDNALNPSMGLPEYLQLTPKTLDKMSVPQVVEHVDKINAWRASQKAEVDKARAANAATVVHKEYPEQGLKWVELKMPDFNSLPLEERKAMIERLREEAKQQGLSPESYIEKYPERMLEDALKYEGEILQHCVGGYCPDVVEGRSRIFSLRDEDGRPHATIEVEPEARIGFRQGEGPKTPDEDYALRNQYVAGVNDGSISNDMTFAEWWRSKNNIPEPVRPERISQIKGLQNKKPEAEFIPYIQDFVKSGDWSHIGDLENTELALSVNAPWRKRFEEVGIEVPDLFSPKDYDDMVRQYFEKTSTPTDPQFMHDTYGFPLKAKGGSVKRIKSVTKADLEREYRMAFGGGVFNTDPDITDSGRIIPEHTI